MLSVLGQYVKTNNKKRTCEREKQHLHTLTHLYIYVYILSTHHVLRKGEEGADNLHPSLTREREPGAGLSFSPYNYSHPDPLLGALQNLLSSFIFQDFFQHQ